MSRKCENCNREMDYFWWELSQVECVPISGDGGGLFKRMLICFCNPTCIKEWWEKRKESRP